MFPIAEILAMREKKIVNGQALCLQSGYQAIGVMHLFQLRAYFVRIAYLVNRYPAASHSFIRREIAGVEAAGGEVLRFSVRGADVSALPDPRDLAEYDKTIVLLNTAKLALLWGLFAKAISSPAMFWHAHKIAFAHCSFRPSEIIKRIAYLAEGAWLAKRLQQQNVAHLHAHFGTNSAMVARLARTFGGPSYSFTVHGPDEFDQPEKLDLKGKIADSAFCAAISSFGRGQLMRWSDFADWSKIEVVRCGVDDNFVSEKPIMPIQDTPYLCAVARLSAQKGIPLIIEAAARLKKEGLHFKISLVGGGEMQAEIEQMIQRLDVADVVTIIGLCSSDEVLQHLEASRAMILPSFAEGLPVVIMEALALGRPVIVSAIAGTPELVDEKCGWLIPSGSVDTLVDAVKQALATPPKEMEQMGQIGRERVLAMHDARHNGAMLLDRIRHYQAIEG
jgi:colanic acid/amylovoran biosynthesis glycosyltransferase